MKLMIYIYKLLFIDHQKQGREDIKKAIVRTFVINVQTKPNLRLTQIVGQVLKKLRFRFVEKSTQ